MKNQGSEKYKSKPKTHGSTSLPAKQPLISTSEQNSTHMLLQGLAWVGNPTKNSLHTIFSHRLINLSSHLSKAFFLYTQMPLTQDFTWFSSIWKGGIICIICSRQSHSYWVQEGTQKSHHTTQHFMLYNTLPIEATENILVAQNTSRLSAFQLFGGLHCLFDRW